MVEHIDVSHMVSATSYADDEDFGDVLVVITQHKKNRFVHVFQCEEMSVMIIDPTTEKRRMIKVPPRQQARTVAALLERIIQHHAALRTDGNGSGARRGNKPGRGLLGRFAKREAPQPDYDEPAVVDVFGTGEGLADLVAGLLDDLRAFATYVEPLVHQVCLFGCWRQRVGGMKGEEEWWW